MTNRQYLAVHNIRCQPHNRSFERSATFASVFCKVSGSVPINEVHNSSCFFWHKKGPDGVEQIIPLSGSSTPASVCMDARCTEKIVWKKSGILTLFK